jgi:hypothetical protein
MSHSVAARAATTLRRLLDDGVALQRVHAAEALIWSGHCEGVRERFLELEGSVGGEPHYRVGVWRVLYRANNGNRKAQEEYLRKIAAVFADTQAEDRGTAAESLCKIGYAGRTPLVLEAAVRGKDDIRVSARWILAHSAGAEDEARLAELLYSGIPKDRYYAAYAFRHFAIIRPTTLTALRDLAEREPLGSEPRCHAIGSLYAHLPPKARDAVRDELLGYAVRGVNYDVRLGACLALARRPTPEMCPIMETLMVGPLTDQRIGAAYVLLRYGSERSSRTDERDALVA